MIEIKLIGLMAHLAGRSKISIVLKGEKEVGKLLSEIIPGFEKVPGKIILVNGKRVEEEYKVKPGDKITVMHSISGGRSLYLPRSFYFWGGD